MNTTTAAGKYQDTRIDVKLVLSAMWIAMLVVFAYVDIFGLFRADVLRAALDGKVAVTWPRTQVEASPTPGSPHRVRPRRQPRGFIDLPASCRLELVDQAGRLQWTRVSDILSDRPLRSA
jgi:hypothetical protein